MAHSMFDDDRAPIDVRLASGLKRAFALPQGNDDLFRPVLEALSRVRRGEERDEVRGAGQGAADRSARGDCLAAS